MTPKQFIKKSYPLYPIDTNLENIKIARDFVMKKWIERSLERGLKTPEDLSGSCKFSSIFASYIFGGKMQGNYEHQHTVVNGVIIDLNSQAKDVLLLDKPYYHDSVFFGSREHKASLKNCAKRVEVWLEEFSLLLESKKEVKKGLSL